MKLSISNIAWDADKDNEVYALMKQYGFSGLEIAPTRIIKENPYDELKEIKQWQEDLYREHHFQIPSMQSIWYGRQENMFSNEAERDSLLKYSQKAIDFAKTIDCKNLVFGCPRNRNIPDGADADIAVPFFRELGDYAERKGTVIGMEANPPIYHTNFINDTNTALELVKKVNSPGFKLNLDVGTMIQNEENVDMLLGQVKHISHVHISEPELKLIERRALHRSLYQLLQEESYQGFVSIEMGKQEKSELIEQVMIYIAQIFSKN